MEAKIVDLKEFKLIGFGKTIKGEDGPKECPKMWDEINDKYFSHLNDGSLISKVIKKNMIGEFALCDDSVKTGYFRYVICGKLVGNEIPSEMEVVDIPAYKWAIFTFKGKLPFVFHENYPKIYSEWFPNHSKYKPACCMCLEWYTNGDTNSDDYECGVWIPLIINKEI